MQQEHHKIKYIIITLVVIFILGSILEFSLHIFSNWKISQYEEDINEAENTFNEQVLFSDEMDKTSAEEGSSDASADAAAFAESVKNNYITYRSTMSEDDAIDKILDDILEDLYVDDADLEGHDLSLVYNGVPILIRLYSPEDGLQM